MTLTQKTIAFTLGCGKHCQKYGYSLEEGEKRGENPKIGVQTKKLFASAIILQSFLFLGLLLYNV